MDRVADMDPTTTILAAVSATATAIAASGKGPHGGGDEDSGECKLLGPFALLVQAALGGLALLSLVWKRYRERPQRPLKVWAFDASKQVVGSILVHLANLFMSMLSAGQFTVQTVVTPGLAAKDEGKFQPNPCSFYLLNLAIDTTIGIPILIFLLRLITRAVALTSFGEPAESIQSGNYGHPPRASWWLKQSLLYFLGLLGMKLCVLFIFSVCPWISWVGDWALRWTEGDERVQVFFVMLLFPLIMNALQYYIIDSFIKDPNGSNDLERLPIADGSIDDDEETRRPHDMSAFEESSNMYPPRRGSSEDTLLSDDDEDIETKESKRPDLRIRALDSTGKVQTRKSRNGTIKAVTSGLQEYNPATDGEDTPTVVGSSSDSSKVSPVIAEGKCESGTCTEDEPR
ncbi:hypothetical protein GP486_002798 [Trichoglossum hirsutum]|uniref:Vacuolar membrane protein n=1 Tax=Trichoglossum hirsutum TaxID=265104 RepID=A0A9P8LE97_9PEZI|nr:hypothetical protein GP486_002798 [Trichoglossum hirsutum]